MVPLPRLAVALGLGLLFMVARPAAADPSAVPLRMEIREQGPQQPWQLVITNRGEKPVELVADTRLLWFEVNVPGKKKPQTCRLPAGLFPTYEKTSLVARLDPGDGVFHAFDPRLYCFAAEGQWQLVPGARVTPHFGWPKETKTAWRRGKKVELEVEQKAPFVAQVAKTKGEPQAADAPEKAEDAASPEQTKELTTTPFALPSTYTSWSRSRLEPDDTDDVEQYPFEIKLNEGSDASAERTTSIRLTIRNRSKETRQLYIRRELISFEVMGPDGLATCDPEPDVRAPDRQAFFSMRPGRSVSLTSRLVELCPRGTFARPGLYLIHARFESGVTGEEFGMNAFVGRFMSKRPANLRVRGGEYEQMKRQPRMRRVRLQDAAR